MKTPSIEGVEFLGVTISFEVPVDRDLYDLGSVQLEKDGRNFVLDVTESTLSDDEDEIECVIEVDTETFPVGEEYNYELMASDFVNGLKGTLYIGDEYEEEPQYMTLFVKIGGMTKAIELKID
jgi:hypothetical protein